MSKWAVSEKTLFRGGATDLLSGRFANYTKEKTQNPEKLNIFKTIHLLIFFIVSNKNVHVILPSV